MESERQVENLQESQPPIPTKEDKLPPYASVGEIVLFVDHVGPARNLVPAIVTRSFGGGRVNLRLFRDNGHGAADFVEYVPFESTGSKVATWQYPYGDGTPNTEPNPVPVTGPLPGVVETA